MSPAPNPLQILVLARRPAGRAAITGVLATSGMNVAVREVDDVEAATRALAERPFDAVLVDDPAVDPEPLELLRWAHERSSLVPFLMVLAEDQQQRAVDLMRQGAADCIPSALLPTVLARSLRQAIRVARAEKATREAQAALAHQADQLARLALASPRIHASLVLEDTIETVAQEARELFNVPFAVTRVAFSGETVVRVAATPGLTPALRRPLPSRALGEARSSVDDIVARIPTPTALHRVEAVKLEESSLLRDLHEAIVTSGFLVEEWLATPMSTRDGKTIGSLHLAVPPGGMSEADLHLLSELATTASIALENAGHFRAAQEATRARDDVLAIVSHDLRNPLNNLGLSATLLGEMLEERESAQGEVELVQRLHRSVERMKRLIEDLLEASLVESGKLTITLRPERAAALVSEALDANSALAAAKGRSLRRGDVDERSMVLADRDRVLQLLGNLIGNALKFTTSDGAVELSVAREGSSVCFGVRDDGPGIDPANLPRLFERFWKGPDAAREGAGLGLFIARGIVEAHGGRIRVESALGTGTVVRFTLPLAAADSAR